ncbi:MAG: RND transporter [Proteobacteria bacterium]|nr:RND transporter [Pseudomonadota bacterium]
MMTLLEFPYKTLVPIAILLSLLPFFPEPHLVEKVRMLVNGNLSKPIDIVDLLWHSWAPVLLAAKLIRDFVL